MSFCSSINDLPPFIITDILSRLPTKTIILCKCVCKSWRSILLDPYFANLHLSKSPTTLIIHQSGISDVLKLVEFQDECGRRDLHPVMKFDLTACYPNAPMHLVGSINGLLCFCDYENESLFICNPTVRQYVSVPEPKHRKRCPLVSVYGFGFSSNSGQYKLVQINQKALYDPALGNCSYEYRGEVYTLGSGKWRSIGTVPFMFSSSVHDTISNGAISNGDGVTLNGNIHWLNCDPESSYSIYYFDIDNESFRGFSSVPGLSKGILCKILVILEGRLCVSDNSSNSDLVIWVMKEYGVSESWTKEFVIRTDDLECLLYAVVTPIKVWRNGDILMLRDDNFLFSYNPGMKTIEEVVVPQDSAQASDRYTDCDVMHHVVSFCSLGDFVAENVHSY